MQLRGDGNRGGVNEHKEFSRLKILMKVQAGRLRVSEAATVLQLQRRQVFRLLRSLREQGAASLASKRRGKRSNNQLPAPVAR